MSILEKFFGWRLDSNESGFEAKNKKQLEKD